MEGDDAPQQDVASSSSETRIKSGYINVANNKQDGNGGSSAFSSELLQRNINNRP